VTEINIIERIQLLKLLSLERSFDSYE